MEVKEISPIFNNLICQNGFYFELLNDYITIEFDAYTKIPVLSKLLFLPFCIAAITEVFKKESSSSMYVLIIYKNVVVEFTTDIFDYIKLIEKGKMEKIDTYVYRFIKDNLKFYITTKKNINDLDFDYILRANLWELNDPILIRVEKPNCNYISVLQYDII